jgi:SAM-dependent methyltransferase
MTQFGQYSNYYDLLYQDKDYVGECRYVLDLLKTHAPETQHILELGCGTGRHADLLAQSGLHVHGVEISEEMLAQAQERAQATASDRAGSFTPAQGDVRTFRAGKKFDAVISLFHVASYQTSNEDIARMFQTASAHLQSGGVFIFDIWYGPAVLTLRPAVRVKRMENEAIHMLRTAEPELDVNASQVHVTYTMFMTDKASGEISTLSETHHMRYFFQPELQVLAQTDGLTLIQAEEWMSGAPPSDSTWGVVYVMRKNEDQV